MIRFDMKYKKNFDLILENVSINLTYLISKAFKNTKIIKTKKNSYSVTITDKSSF